jgi:glucokinase
MTKLLVDIGGTYVRMALSEDGHTLSHDPQKIKAAQFANFEDALLRFVQSQKKDPATIRVITIAKSGRNNWSIDCAAIQAIFPSAQVALINDFEANAMGLVAVKEGDVIHLGGTNHHVKTNLPRAVIGSGTGLGLAYISPNGHVQKTHGGHMLPTLTTPAQHDIFAELQHLKTDKTISIYEDALSGNGILNMYKILCARAHVDCEYTDTHHLLAAGRNNPLVQQSLKLYHEILGQFAHQVLAFGYAYGGLFLTGGVTDRLIGHDLFDRDTFFAALYQKNVPVVLQDVQATPVFWVKDEFISLKGLLATN